MTSGSHVCDLVPSQDSFPKLQKQVLGHSLGEDIGKLLLSVNRFDVDLLSSGIFAVLGDVFSEMMILQVDVLGARTDLGRASHLQCARIVFKCRAEDLQLLAVIYDPPSLALLHQVHQWDGLTQGLGQGAILGFGCTEADLSDELGCPQDGTTGVPNEVAQARPGSRRVIQHGSLLVPGACQISIREDLESDRPIRMVHDALLVSALKIAAQVQYCLGLWSPGICGAMSSLMSGKGDLWSGRFLQKVKFPNYGSIAPCLGCHARLHLTISAMFARSERGSPCLWSAQ
eukprot:scaffold1786_cov138-Cylindrotheca_fusiformis.AAC.1